MCADEKVEDTVKSFKPWMVIVLMDPAPDEVNDTTKLDTTVARMRCGSFAVTILIGFEPDIGVAEWSNIGGKAIPNMASTLSPKNVKVQIEKSLRAATAAVGVKSPPTEQRTTAFETREEPAIMMVREELLVSSAVLETKTGNCWFRMQLPARPTPVVEKPCRFLKTKDVTDWGENNRNSTINVVGLLLRYWDNNIEAERSGP